MKNLLRRVYRNGFTRGIYHHVPLVKPTVNKILGIYAGLGNLMTNRIYWCMYTLTHYSRPDYKLLKKRHIRRMTLPIDDTGVIYINPDRIEYAIAPSEHKCENIYPIENGRWDLRKERLESIGMELGNTDTSDEIRVAIDRNGGFLLEGGRQRLAMAKKSGTENIPIIVTRRHYHWAKLRKEVFLYSQEQPSGSYQLPVHPDLQKIHAHRKGDRWELIENNLPLRSGTVLDIGSNWGYFCHKFEDLGFDCYAVELNYRWLYFLKKLKKAENRRFEIIPRSVFDIKRKKYDIVLALSIFHHFLRSEVLYNKLTRLLGELDMKVMFFEPHKTGYGYAGAYIDYSENEFVDYILQNSCLSKCKLLSRTERGRNLYLLSSS